MLKPFRIDFLWRCHWSHIDGPVRDGRAIKTPVWVCEHPYRTLRPLGPGPDCEDCPNRVRAAEGSTCDPPPDSAARFVGKLVH
jgi:hypothetical protein